MASSCPRAKRRSPTPRRCTARHVHTRMYALRCSRHARSAIFPGVKPLRYIRGRAYRRSPAKKSAPQCGLQGTRANSFPAAKGMCLSNPWPGHRAARRPSRSPAVVERPKEGPNRYSYEGLRGESPGGERAPAKFVDPPDCRGAPVHPPQSGQGSSGPFAPGDYEPEHAEASQHECVGLWLGNRRADDVGSHEDAVFGLAWKEGDVGRGERRPVPANVVDLMTALAGDDRVADKRGEVRCGSLLDVRGIGRRVEALDRVAARTEI